jgi:hypothetical protein
MPMRSREPEQPVPWFSRREKVVRAVPDVVTAHPLGSVLILSEFTEASFDQEAIRVMKETAVFDKL